MKPWRDHSLTGSKSTLAVEGPRQASPDDNPEASADESHSEGKQLAQGKRAARGRGNTGYSATARQRRRQDVHRRVMRTPVRQLICGSPKGGWRHVSTFRARCGRTCASQGVHDRGSSASAIALPSGSGTFTWRTPFE